MSLTPEEIVERIEKRMAEHPALVSRGRATHARDLAEKLKKLGTAVNRIECKLGKKWINGRDMHPFVTRQQFENWKTRARIALAYLREERQELTRAIHEARRVVDALAAGIADPDDPRCVLEACYTLMRSFYKRLGYPEITAEEKATMNAVEEHLYTFVRVEVPDYLDDDEEDFDEDEWLEENDEETYDENEIQA